MNIVMTYVALALTDTLRGVRTELKSTVCA